jgi:hypothetical protein
MPKLTALCANMLRFKNQVRPGHAIALVDSTGGLGALQLNRLAGTRIEGSTARTS